MATPYIYLGQFTYISIILLSHGGATFPMLSWLLLLAIPAPPWVNQSMKFDYVNVIYYERYYPATIVFV